MKCKSPFQLIDRNGPEILRLLILAMIVLLFGCGSAGEREYKRGKTLADKGEFSEALQHFDRAILRSSGEPETVLAASREAARVSFFETKNFAKAADYYRNLVLVSKDAQERLEAQKQIADIFFEHLTDYSKAAAEINKLLSMISDELERSKYKIKLARSYFYLNNFAQALAEVEEFLKKSKNDESDFEMLVLKGNTYLAQKNLQAASQVFKDLVTKYPERSVKENVALTLAVAYEEMKDFANAIAVLETMKSHHPMPEYIDIRIKRLSERRKNQPGARGMRK